MRSHRYVNARTCQRVLGYDANALYPSTMLQEMPCGPGKVVHYENLADEVDRLVSRLRRKMWFGFALVDIRVPRELWENSKNFLLQQRGDSGAHERVFGTNQANRITIL